MNVITKIIGDKKEWKAMEARADALPHDFHVVYDEMKSYLWKFTSGDGLDIIAILKDVLTAFETGAAEGNRVLDVTGPDVAAYCDEQLHRVSRGTSYVDRWRGSLNHNVATKLAR